MQSSHERLLDLRNCRNEVERTMSALRPDPGMYPDMYDEWVNAMGLLARMHGGLNDLVRLNLLYGK
jgi:hypothetical protein